MTGQDALFPMNPVADPTMEETIANDQGIEVTNAGVDMENEFPSAIVPSETEIESDGSEQDIEKDYTTVSGPEGTVLNSELTILADIITNLIYRHIKFMIDKGFSSGLNGTEIFSDFVLQKKIIYLDDNNFYDKMYKK